MNGDDRKLTRVVTAISAVAAILVALLPPSIYYVQSHALLAQELAIKASVKADLVSHLATRSPESWRYQDTRLVELLQSAPAEIGEDRARVLSLDGRAAAEVGSPPRGRFSAPLAAYRAGWNTIGGRKFALDRPRALCLSYECHNAPPAAAPAKGVHREVTP